jgi:archaellum component FlaC
MISTEEQLKRIQDKLQQILKQYIAVQKENQKLKAEFVLVREQFAQQKKNVDELKQQVSILKLGTGDMNEIDKKEFERRINGYLKEIDRCITQISE